MRWLASLVSLLTQAEALGDSNEVSASPPWGGGLQAQFRFSMRLRPCVTRIKLPLHDLDEVACKLSLSFHPGKGVG